MPDADATKPTRSSPAGDGPEAHEDDGRAIIDIHVEGQRRVVTMIRWLLYLFFLVLGYIVLRRLAPVLTPVLVAGGIAYLLDPLVDRLEARGMKRVYAVALLLVTFVGTLVIAIIVLIPVVRDSVSDFIENLPGMVDRATDWLEFNLGYHVPDKWQDALHGEHAEALLEDIAGPAPALAAAAVGGVFSVLGFFAELLLIPVFAFYFLVDWDNIVARVRSMIPPRHRARVVDIVGEIDSVVSNWLRGQLTVTSILAVLYAAWFYAADVPLAIPVGFLVGALTIIPFLGTFVGAGITAVLILLNWQGPEQAIAIVIAFVVLHLIEAAVLTPKLVGKRVGLGESGALFAVLAGGQLLGLAGVLLAVPLAASVAVLIRRFLRYYEESEFFGAADDDQSLPVPESALSESRAAEAVSLKSGDDSGDDPTSGASEDPENQPSDPVGEDADRDASEKADKEDPS